MQNQRMDGLRNSLGLFNQALDVDPGYALAWTGLADAHRRLAFLGVAEPRAAFAEVDRALRRALAIAPTLADAHATLGYKLFNFDYDWPGAEAAWRNALATNPSQALAHFGLGQMLITQDGWTRATATCARPASWTRCNPSSTCWRPTSCWSAGARPRAGPGCRACSSCSRSCRWPTWCRGQQQFGAGQTEPGIAALRQAVALAGPGTVFDSLLGYYLARAGQADEARAILAQLNARAATRYVAGSLPAAVHAGLGQTDAALAALERAYTQRDPRLAFVKDAPYWTGLRQQPRFRALLQKLRLDRFGPGVWNP